MTTKNIADSSARHTESARNALRLHIAVLVQPDNFYLLFT